MVYVLKQEFRSGELGVRSLEFGVWSLEFGVKFSPHLPISPSPHLPISPSPHLPISPSPSSPHPLVIKICNSKPEPRYFLANLWG
ncbi:MAG: hypothetical protein RMY29_028235 [Nostoc sp. CreGUA01]